VRIPTLIALALAAAACSPLDASVQRVGSVYFPANGVALFADGRNAHAGMLGSTCELTVTGDIGDDRSVDGRGAPEILGGGTERDGDVVLVRTRERLHLMEGPRSSGWRSAVRSTAAIDFAGGPAALADGAVVALDGCQVTWFDRAFEPVGAGDAALDACDGATLAVDPSTANAFVAAGGAVVAVTPDGSVALPGRADALTFSTETGDLLLTDHLDATVRAVDADGGPRWDFHVGDPILQVADFPGSGLVAVVASTSTADDEGARLVFLDAATGRPIHDLALPREATISTSQDGRTFALLRPRMTQFFRLR
jgi:hypothetical protein